MRITVDRDRCQGHGNCAMRAPGLFHLGDEDGRASVTADEIPGEQEPQARSAEASCPERAIAVRVDDRPKK